MTTSDGRIQTTHTGSLPRSACLDSATPGAVRDAVALTVRRQVQAGVDIIGDGEASRRSYVTYVTARLSGFGAAGQFTPLSLRDLAAFADFAEVAFGDPALEPLMTMPGCVGPVACTSAWPGAACGRHREPDGRGGRAAGVLVGGQPRHHRAFHAQPLLPHLVATVHGVSSDQSAGGGTTVLARRKIKGDSAKRHN
jgi:hypothetical protein